MRKLCLDLADLQFKAHLDSGSKAYLFEALENNWKSKIGFKSYLCSLAQVTVG